jgi:hypothetical protein
VGSGADQWERRDGRKHPTAAASTATTAASTATTSEGRAQEPVVRAGSAGAASEKVIVESACPQFRICERERARRRGGAAGRVHHQDAVRRFRSRAADVGDVHRCVAGRCGARAVDNQTVGRRSVASQESIEGESAAGAAKVAAIHVQDVADAIPGTKLYGALIDQIAGDGESSGR